MWRRFLCPNSLLRADSPLFIHPATNLDYGLRNQSRCFIRVRDSIGAFEICIGIFSLLLEPPHEVKVSRRRKIYATLLKKAKERTEVGICLLNTESEVHRAASPGTKEYIGQRRYSSKRRAVVAVKTKTSTIKTRNSKGKDKAERQVSSDSISAIPWASTYLVDYTSTVV